MSFLHVQSGLCARCGYWAATVGDLCESCHRGDTGRSRSFCPPVRVPDELAALQECLGCPDRAGCLNVAVARRDVSRPRAGLSTAELRYLVAPLQHNHRRTRRHRRIAA